MLEDHIFLHQIFLHIVLQFVFFFHEDETYMEQPSEKLASL